MILQLIIGSLVVSLTVVVEAALIASAIRILKSLRPWLATPPHTLKYLLALTGVILWLLGALTASVWIWAVFLVGLGAFETFEPALYFSVVVFTTLGLGDITLAEPWRLLSGISAANGLILFGVSTAFLVDILSRLRQVQEEQRLGA